jgi:hypothetical protein
MNYFDFFDNIGGIFLYSSMLLLRFFSSINWLFYWTKFADRSSVIFTSSLFCFFPALVFNIISKTKIEAELASQMIFYIFAVQFAIANLGFMAAKAPRQLK